MAIRRTLAEFSDDIASADIADNAVTTAKILDANVTTAKIADNSITLAKILDEGALTQSAIKKSFHKAWILG